MKLALFSIVLVFSFLVFPNFVFAQSQGDCGDWNFSPTLQCLASSGCTPRTYSCSNGQSATYCGSATVGPPSSICQLPPGVGVTPSTFDDLNKAIFGSGGPDTSLTPHEGLFLDFSLIYLHLED